MEGFTWTLAIFALLAIGSSAEDCKDEFLSCVVSKDKDNLYCDSPLMDYCNKSCNFCTAREYKPIVCEDQFTSCALYKRLGEMDCSRSAVKAACMKTCGVCEPVGIPDKRWLLTLDKPKPRVCRDSGGRWCSRMKEFNRLKCSAMIKKKCKKSCGLCIDTGEIECKDGSRYCPLAAFDDEKCETGHYQKKCPKSCDVCGSGFGDKIRTLCKDYSHKCLIGDDFVCFSMPHGTQLCPKTCGHCNFLYDN
ncbi:unnamed protein product [Owenia fusiformis]|uniref:ShKT domain-containing protein n=1 Tax=Owenia fusiformis TaxID=6347 RepID=A0A8S4PXZ4_OWEFU|nr:unnamed protein product [Owenia fusiformis]